jgi:hypothetical protein
VEMPQGIGVRFRRAGTVLSPHGWRQKAAEGLPQDAGALFGLTPIQRLLAKTRRSVLKSAPRPQCRVAAEFGLHSRLQANNFRTENKIKSRLCYSRLGNMFFPSLVSRGGLWRFGVIEMAFVFGPAFFGGRREVLCRFLQPRLSGSRRMTGAGE